MCLITQVCNLWFIADGQPGCRNGDLFLFRSVSHGLRNPDIWYCWGFPCLLNSLLGSVSYLRLPVPFFPDTSSSHCHDKHFLLPFACAEGACGRSYWTAIQTCGKWSLGKLVETGMLLIEGLQPPSSSLITEGGMVYSMLALRGSNKLGCRLIPFFVSCPSNELGIAKGLGRSLQRK